MYPWSNPETIKIHKIPSNAINSPEHFNDAKNDQDLLAVGQEHQFKILGQYDIN